MGKKKVTKRIVRPATEEEMQRHAEVREKVMNDFPPKKPTFQLVKTGVAAKIRKARKAKGLSWYALAKQAGIPNPNTIRDIEAGRDAKISNIDAIAKVLGLKLDLVEAEVS